MNDDTSPRAEVIDEIVKRLEPFRPQGVVVGGATVITKDLSLDSLAVMDMVMELEDRFDISIPLNTLADIHTVDQLADTIMRIRAK
jgi:acyl carrier protein